MRTKDRLLLFAALVCLLQFSQLSMAQNSEEWLPELRFSKVQNREKFNGDRWSYMTAGPSTALPILALHGLGDNSMAWRYQYEPLGDKYRFIAWNAPGYLMSSELVETSPGCADYADALKDFADSIGVEKFVILGNSFGSRVAQCFTLSYPERVLALVFVGPSAGRKEITAEEKGKYLAERKAQIGLGSYEFPGKRAKALVSPAASPELLEHMTNTMRATNERGFLQGAHFAVSTGYDPETLSSRIKVPLLIIAGALDTVSPVESHARTLSANIANSRLVILESTGHLPHLERAAAVNREIMKFIREMKI